MNQRTNKPQPTKSQSVAGNVAQKKSNNTGFPDNLKSGIENLSGHFMDDVKVHYNSARPAQLQAHAFAQGNQIHLASGQEKHLPHEAWHVVQQKQGRVKPTMQLKSNVPVNDDPGLEHEADVMGARAVFHQSGDSNPETSDIGGNIIQRVPIQAKITGITHFVQAVHGSIYKGIKGKALTHGQEIEVETDDKIRSRRGPNQEIFSSYDAKNTTEYRWIKLLKIGRKLAPKDAYVRDDTFVGGANIPTGRIQYPPSIDHRQRLNPALPPRTFAHEHAPQWYERDLGHPKSSTADRKHAKLLATAFGGSPDETGRRMVASAKDPDTLMALETVGLHMTHVAPWIPTDVERHGKDRHEDYDKSGEYFRTSQTHPVHGDYEMHQQILGIHEPDVTTDPVNPGWAHIAEMVMGVPNMKDDVRRGPNGIEVRAAQDPKRIAKGPGAVIGHEEMARETAKMRHVLLQALALRDHELSRSDFRQEVARIDAEIQRLKGIEGNLDAEKTNLIARIAGYPDVKKDLGPQIGAAKQAENDALVAKLQLQMQQNASNEAQDKARLKELDAELVGLPVEISKLTKIRVVLEAKRKIQEKYRGSMVIGMEREKLQTPKKVDLSPLDRLTPTPPVAPERSFASSLIGNRSNVKLPHLFDEYTINGVTDVSGDHHPNIILEKDAWKVKDGTQTGLKKLQEGWHASGLHTDLQERGSFGHHRPSVSPLDNGRVRINPGLYPMSLLQIGIGSALGAKKDRVISAHEDLVHRDALHVAVQHAFHVIAADRPGKSEKIHRIKTFAKHRLMINLLKAQTILKAPIPKPEHNRDAYIAWLQKDFSKTALALENLNESTHLLLSARVNEESKSEDYQEPLLLQPSPFQNFIKHEFGGHDKGVAIYYVASGMQAITTGAIAAIAYRREMKGEPASRPAGYVRLHPYFEMRGQAAAAAGFRDDLRPETIISDLSPVDTNATPAEQSQEAVAHGLNDAVKADRSLVPVLDATATPLTKVKSMVPADTQNFIIVESLTKYAQLGSDKALGGRIIAVGSPAFLKITSGIISPVEQNAGMVVSRVWFQSMEDMRYSH